MQQDTVAAKPLLRGWLHAVTVVPALLGATALVIAAHQNSALQLSLIVYGVSLVLLFAVSASYHVPRWSARWDARWRRLDHSMIFVVIAGTYTPVSVNVLDGPLRVAILATIWALALVGVMLCMSPFRLPRRLLAVAYVAVGWVAVAALPALAVRLGVPGLLYMVGGGLLYSIGALVYASRWPQLWPKVFGYHELFHVMVIAASAVFFAFIATDVVPLHGA